MTKYKCGHEAVAIIMNNSPLAYVAYFEWIDSTGFNGTREECFECFCSKKRRKGNEK